MKYLIIFVILISIFYILWINGHLTLQVKSAALFVGSIKQKNRSKATFSSCNGWIKRVIKFKESRNYEFDFIINITKGNVMAEIQDENKQAVLLLDKNCSMGTVNIDKSKRYYLIFRFEKADGNYELTWK